MVRNCSEIITEMGCVWFSNRANSTFILPIDPLLACSFYFIWFWNVSYCILLHDYNLCFNVYPCSNISYYNSNSVWPYCIVIHILNHFHKRCFLYPLLLYTYFSMAMQLVIDKIFIIAHMMYVYAYYIWEEIDFLSHQRMFLMTSPWSKINLDNLHINEAGSPLIIMSDWSLIPTPSDIN